MTSHLRKPGMLFLLLNLAVAALLPVIRASTSISHPVITLSHGGQIKGTQFEMENTKVSMFAGIPYAKPPTGSLRFCKPQPAVPWTGIRDGSKNKQIACIQNAMLGSKAGNVIGMEDCLYLDVWVPGDVIPTADKKAVMVWIHGGAYVMGQGTTYPFMVFADEGDVIVVSLNYRVGPFGFLSEGKGTGNFGLWDQRQALVWVQENIDRFGGDPTRVTIFGESAGGGSVSALTLSPHSEGLFHRGISQSGSLFSPWSWAHTDKRRMEKNLKIAQKFNCTDDTGLYDCLSGKDAYQVAGLVSDDDSSLPLHPFPDNDFFDDAVELWSYNTSKRFDVMIGYNGQDSMMFTAMQADTLLAALNKTCEMGLSSDSTSQYLQMFRCQEITPISAELCAHYLEQLYNFSSVTCNKERLRRLVDLDTDFWFGQEARSSLLTHAEDGDKSTYGYVLAEPYRGSTFYPVPEWLKTQGDHGDDLIFLLGDFKLAKALNRTEQDLYEKPMEDFIVEFIRSGVKETLPLSSNMIRMWTNFAKSGNPNLPVKDSSVPEWPQFTSADEQVMELKIKPQVVTIPRRNTVQAMHDSIVSILKRRYAAERVLPITTSVDVLSIVSLTTKQAGQVIVALLALIVLLVTEKFR